MRRPTAKRRATTTQVQAQVQAATPQAGTRSAQGRPSASGLARMLGRGPSDRVPRPPSRIEVGQDWRRCGAEEGGCGVLLPLSTQTCPRCGRITREDLLPLNIRRLLPTHDGYEHALTVLRGTEAVPPDPLPPDPLPPDPRASDPRASGPPPVSGPPAPERLVPDRPVPELADPDPAGSGAG